MRESLYLKDDDYPALLPLRQLHDADPHEDRPRADRRAQRLSPLYVSIHSTDPDLRSRILHNKKGHDEYVWLERLLNAGIQVHGQVVAAPASTPGRN